MRLNPLWLAESGEFERLMPLVMQKLSEASFSDAVNLRGSDNAESSPDGYKPYTMDGSVAKIEMIGAMTKRPNCMQMFYGGAATRAVEEAVTVAAADPNVKSILLIIDSPGGNIDGTAELAGAIASAREQKPVWGWVDGLMASAALWAGVHCDYLFASSPNANIGSIGVITAVVDQSGDTGLKERGIKIHKIDTGPYKGIGAYFSPVTADQIQVIRDRVDAIGQAFAETVSRERNIPVTIGEGVADGRVFLASEAKTLGLIDGIAPVSSVLNRMKSGYNLRRDKSQYKATALPKPKTEGEKAMPTTDDIRAEDEGLMAKFRAWGEKLGIIKAEAEPADDATEASPDMTALTTEIESLRAELDAEKTITANQAEMIGRLKMAGDVTGQDALEALIKDGVTARAQAAEQLAKQMNRVLGAGVTNASTIAAKFAGKTLAEFTAEIAPYLSAADAKFAPNPKEPLTESDGLRRTTADDQPGTQSEKDAAEEARRQKVAAQMRGYVSQIGE
jgi:signal peptide peptidase SppA